MKRQLRNRLLSELLDLLLCILVAVAMGYAAHCHVRDVVRSTISDIIHAEWVKAARHADEPSEEIPLGDDTPQL